jgi:threonine dehydrogenase-like Zn-dependent dehydrogenase
VRALTFVGRRDVCVRTVADPALEAPTDAVVAVKLAGICGSDLHVYHEREKGIDPGTTMGHELVGTIVELGRDVVALQRGDRVACPFTTSCGRCFYCVRGLTCRCPEGQLLGWVEGGQGLQGAQAELVRVPLADSCLVRLPDAVGDEAGLLLGDVLPTGWFAADPASVSGSGRGARPFTHLPGRSGIGADRGTRRRRQPRGHEARGESCGREESWPRWASTPGRRSASAR